MVMGEQDWTAFVRVPGDVLDPNGTVGERWENNRYQVIKRTLRGSEWGAVVHLTIRNVDGSRRRSWTEFQRLKNELVGPEYDAVEVYPAESRVVDTVDHYHLWVLLDRPVPFGLRPAA